MCLISSVARRPGPTGNDFPARFPTVAATGEGTPFRRSELLDAALTRCQRDPLALLVVSRLLDLEEGARRLAEPYLEEGEEIKQLLVAHQSILEPHWAIVVTDRAILVLEPGAVRPAITGRIRGRHSRRVPRATRLGPIHGEGWIVVDGERFFVPGQKRTIAAIDAEAGFPPPTA